MSQLIGKLLTILRRSSKHSPLLAQELQDAISRHQSGRLDEAEVLYRRILSADAKNPDALHLLGVIAQQRGNSSQALELISKSVKLKPDQHVALNNQGVAYRALGRQGDAAAAFHKALALKSDYAEAYNNLGITYQLQAQVGKAEEAFRAALEIRPGYAEALTNLGNILHEQGRLEEAGACHRQAITLNPLLAVAFYNLGMVLKQQLKPKEAEQCYRKTLELAPHHAGAYNNLGTLFEEHGDLAQALACYEKAVNLDPSDATSMWNLAVLSLLTGNYEKGWRYHEQRFAYFRMSATESALLNNRLNAFQRWTGEPISGKRLLVWTEQGLGDNLMVMRFLPLLKAKGTGTVIVYCAAPLVRLINALPGVDRVISTDKAPPLGLFDFHCPMMSLPFIFNTRLDSIPDQVPYLSISESLVRNWENRIGHIRKVKVGLAWAGNSALRDDSKRSIPLRQFEPLLGIAGVQLISLQKGTEAQTLAGLHWDILDFMDECHDLMDTAALVFNLDLVISVDTAVAHLAGALSKPVWLLNRYSSEWRWGLQREDSPWYPSMRIFRQTASLEWDSVIQRVAMELGK